MYQSGDGFKKTSQRKYQPREKRLTDTLGFEYTPYTLEFIYLNC